METNEHIKTGMTNEGYFKVEDQDTAVEVGSGSLPVLATPRLVAHMERLAHSLLESHLPQGFSSVGVSVDVQHLAPTPAGETVQVKCEVLEIDGRQVTFAVEAWDNREKIAEGRHRRVIIEVSRFMQRVEAKKTK